MKIVNSASRRTYEVEKYFLEVFKLSDLRMFRSSLFHSITAEGKKEFWKKFYLNLQAYITQTATLL